MNSFLLITLSFLIKSILSADLQLQSGTNPQSIILDNGNIFLICSTGAVIYTKTGTKLGGQALTDTGKNFNIGKFPDGSLIVYNGVTVTFFSSEGAYVSQYDYSLPAWVYSPMIIKDNDSFILISPHSTNEMKVAVMNKTGEVSQRTQNVNGDSSANNINCVTRTTKDFSLLCVHYTTARADNLELFTLNSRFDMAVHKAITHEPIEGSRIERIDTNDYLVYYKDRRYVLFYFFYNDLTRALTPVKTIPTAGLANQFYSIKMLYVKLIGMDKLLFTYAAYNYNAVTVLDYKSDTSLFFNFPTNSRTSAPVQSSLLTFPDNSLGLVYESEKAIYYLSLNIPICSNFCGKIKTGGSLEVNLQPYSSTSAVTFRNIDPASTSFMQNNAVCVNSLSYSTLLPFVFNEPPAPIIVMQFEFISSIVSAEVVCSITLHSSTGGSCACAPSYFTYNDACVEFCPAKTEIDTVAKKCTNCKTIGKYLYKGQCLVKDAILAVHFVSDEEFNVVEDCNTDCLKCERNANRCTQCQTGNGLCQRCADGKYAEAVQGVSMECKTCYKTCGSCDFLGDDTQHRCVTCLAGYESHTTPFEECYATCGDTQKWIIKDSKVECLNIPACEEPEPIFVPDTNQCVESCSTTSTCVICKTFPNGMFNDKGNCVTDCPSGTEANLTTNVCDIVTTPPTPPVDPPPPPVDPPTPPVDPPTPPVDPPTPTPDSNTTDKPLEDFLDDLNKSDLNMSIIKGDNFTVEIYNSTTPGDEDDLTRIILTQCENILREHYSLKPEDVLIFVKVDLNRTNAITNQVEYRIYDTMGNQLDLGLCENTTVEIIYPIKNTTGLDIDIAKEFEKLGIDIYNQEDPFFVDICFPFSTDQGTDIILRDRLKDIYKNISLCEANCNYDSVDLEELTVKCLCKIKEEIQTQPEPNVFADAITTAFTDSNFMVIRCYNLVFDMKILMYNVGFWFYLVFIVLHVPNWFYYFVKGSEPIQKYIKECPKANPGKPGDYFQKIINDSGHKGNDEESNLSSLYRNARRSKHERNEESASPRKLPQQRRSLFEPNVNPYIINEDNERRITVGPQEKDYSNNEPFFKGNLHLVPIFIDKDTDNSMISSKYNYHNQINQYYFPRRNNNGNGSQFIGRSSLPLNTLTNTEKNVSMLIPQSKNSMNSLNKISVYSNYIPHYNQSNKRQSTAMISSGELNTSYEKESKVSDQVLCTSPSVIKPSMQREKVVYRRKGVCKEKGSSSTVCTENIKTRISNATITEASNGMITNPSKKKPSMDVMDDYDVHDAKKYDTRSFCRLFYICLKMRHQILATFVKEWPLDLRCIIIILFLFGFVIDFAFNALFYTNELISNKYNYEGNLGLLFTLGNNMITAVASFVVSAILMFFLSLLSTSQNAFNAFIVSQGKLKNPNDVLRKTLVCYKVKLSFFMFFELILFLFFWYYSCAFCAVYQSSQIDWLTSGFITFAIGLFIPIPICLVIVLVRGVAIEKEQNWLYRFSIWCYKF